MEIIKEPKKNIALLWRPPKTVQTIYRPMKYLLSAIVDDGLLLYNVVTSEMILLSDEEKTMFEGLPATYGSEMDELIAHHFIVTEDFKENKSVRELRTLLKKLEPSKRVNGFTILPTTECNARCYYCFESNHKRCTLTKKMSHDVVEYIVDVCDAKPIEIQWFGGEPLVGSKYISQICAGLKQKQIQFRSTMVSNAYLFDEKLIRVARNEWNLNNVQITLDGTEEVYNETKAYISPENNPFKRVIQNIEQLLKNGITVNVRLNVTAKNYNDLGELIELLANRFGGKRGFTCYSHAVYEGVGFEPLEYDDDKRELVDLYTTQLDSRLMERGMLGSYSRLPSLMVYNCMSDNDSCRVIYPDGKIGKCENQSSEDSIGDIYCDIIDLESEKRYKEVERFQECENCCLYPRCVNLKICPETGKCTSLKLSWRTQRYKILMKELYMKYKEDSIKQKMDNSTNQVECDS